MKTVKIQLEARIGGQSRYAQRSSLQDLINKMNACLSYIGAHGGTITDAEGQPIATWTVTGLEDPVLKQATLDSGPLAESPVDPS